MRRFLLVVVFVALLAGWSVSLLADEAPAPPTAPTAPTSPATPAAPTGPSAGPGRPVPAVFPFQNFVRPAPCVVMALQILNPRMVSLLATRLNLTEEEKAKVTDFLTKADEAGKPKIEAQKKAAEAFVATLTKEGSTQEEMAAAGEAAMKAESAILMDRIKCLVDLRALLTPEQNKELPKVIEMYTGQWRPQTAPMGVLSIPKMGEPEKPAETAPK